MRAVTDFLLSIVAAAQTSAGPVAIRGRGNPFSYYLENPDQAITVLLTFAEIARNHA
jgi:hypothetical protein